MSNDQAKQSITLFGIIAIIALLMVNAYLFYNKYNLENQLVTLEQEIHNKEEVRTQLESDYYTALNRLEEMRGDNEDLDLVINHQKEELRLQKDRISRLISDNKDLSKAKIEMNTLRKNVDTYIDQINQLKNENMILLDTTVALRAARMQLTQRIAQERQQNDHLMNSTAELTKEKKTLEKVNSLLANKVNVASVIQVENVEVQGYDYKNNGKERSKNRAKNVELLKICFDAKENFVVDGGNEDFFVRIIDPSGQTLALESHGSGVLFNDASQEQIRYTRIVNADYENQIKSICTSWEPNLPFSAGKYLVEIYNKGYLSGRGEVVLN